MPNTITGKWISNQWVPTFGQFGLGNCSFWGNLIHRHMRMAYGTGAACNFERHREKRKCFSHQLVSVIIDFGRYNRLFGYVDSVHCRCRPLQRSSLFEPSYRPNTCPDILDIFYTLKTRQYFYFWFKAITIVFNPDYHKGIQIMVILFCFWFIQPISDISMSLQN